MKLDDSADSTISPLAVRSMGHLFSGEGEKVFAACSAVETISSSCIGY